MHTLTRLSFVWIMACRTLDSKPLTGPILTYPTETYSNIIRVSEITNQDFFNIGGQKWSKLFVFKDMEVFQMSIYLSKMLQLLGPPPFHTCIFTLTSSKCRHGFGMDKNVISNC